MGYDLTGQMTSVSGTAPGIGAVSGVYAYNGEDKRVFSSVNGRDMFYAYDAKGRLILTYKPQDGESVERLYLESGQALAKWTTGAESALTYLHTDHLGTPVRGTHALGRQLNPDGLPTTFVGAEIFSDFSSLYGLNPLPLWHGNGGSGFDPATGQGSNCGVTGFTTHVRDCDTGLQYMQARYYDAGLARFLSIDPVTFMDKLYPGQVNRYAYTWNNPVNAIDPDGEFLNFVAGAVIGASVEVFMQTVVEGKSLSEINYKQVGVGAALGAVTSGATALGKGALTGSVKVAGEKIALKTGFERTVVGGQGVLLAGANGLAAAEANQTFRGSDKSGGQGAMEGAVNSLIPTPLPEGTIAGLVGEGLGNILGDGANAVVESGTPQTVVEIPDPNGEGQLIYDPNREK